MSAEELALTAVEGGTRLRLRVKPGAKSASIVGVYGGALKITVNAAPERGKANAAVVELLARALGVPQDAIAIVGGAGSQDKVAVVRMPLDETRRRLEARLK